MGNEISQGNDYVCTVCHQTWFRKSVSNTNNITGISSEMIEKCYAGKKSYNDQEWICSTCKSNLKDGKIPTISVINGFKFPNQPDICKKSKHNGRKNLFA